MSDDVMVEEFKIEAAELFEEAENSLLNIDKGQDFLSNYNSIFRAFHSLKGAAGMFGLTELQEHMHKLESLFEAQKKIATMNNKQVDYFLSGIDAAKKLLNGEHANFYHIDMGSFNEIEKDPSSPAAKPTPTKLKPKLDRKKGVIMVVAEDLTAGDAITKILDEHEFMARSYQDKASALADFDELNPDAVVASLSMIKEMQEAEIDTPSVFIADSFTQDSLKEAFKNGAVSFISKPYEPMQIIGLCYGAIQKNRTMKLLETSVNYILYQFTDLDLYLKSQGKDGIRTALKKDLQHILEQRKVITHFTGMGE